MSADNYVIIKYDGKYKGYNQFASNDEEQFYHAMYTTDTLDEMIAILNEEVLEYGYRIDSSCPEAMVNLKAKIAELEESNARLRHKAGYEKKYALALISVAGYHTEIEGLKDALEEITKIRAAARGSEHQMQKIATEALSSS